VADVYMCSHCGSTNLMARMQDFQCLECGNRTDVGGAKLPLEPVFAGSPTAFERRPQ
jgi:ribosomal protein L37AE/L43A